MNENMIDDLYSLLHGKYKTDYDEIQIGLVEEVIPNTLTLHLQTMLGSLVIVSQTAERTFKYLNIAEDFVAELEPALAIESVNVQLKFFLDSIDVDLKLPKLYSNFGTQIKLLEENNIISEDEKIILLRIKDKRDYYIHNFFGENPMLQTDSVRFKIVISELALINGLILQYIEDIIKRYYDELAPVYPLSIDFLRKTDSFFESFNNVVKELNQEATIMLHESKEDFKITKKVGNKTIIFSYTNE